MTPPVERPDEKGLLPVEDTDQPCSSSSNRRATVVYLLLLLLLPVLTIFMGTNYVPVLIVLLVSWLIGGIAGWVAGPQLFSLQARWLGGDVHWQRSIIGALGGGAISMALLPCAIVLTPVFVKSVHKVDLTGFAKEFEVLADFAKRNFDKSVVLATADESYAFTVQRSTTISPAAMSSGPQVCELLVSPFFLRMSYLPPARHQDAFFTGVLMHEFAHCLDLQRDFSAAFASHSPPRSLPPSVAVTVSDGLGFYKAHRKGESVLWGEIYADIFMVGYWRMAHPDAAPELTKFLRDRRQVGDNDHQTVCWLDLALKAPLPASARELGVWSDRLRSANHCSYPGPRPAHQR